MYKVNTIKSFAQSHIENIMGRIRPVINDLQDAIIVRLSPVYQYILRRLTSQVRQLEILFSHHKLELRGAKLESKMRKNRLSKLKVSN